MSGKSCHSGHRERVRKRYHEFGIYSFHEHELLELILFYGIPLKNTNEIAHRLIEKFGCLDEVLKAPEKELTKIKGIGASAAVFLKTFGDICGEYKEFISVNQYAMSADEYVALIREYFSDTEENKCIIFCPDTNFRISFSADIFLENTKDTIPIMNNLVKKESSRIVVAVNKMNSTASPNQNDIQLMDIISEKLSAVGIRLQDFLIIGKRSAYSLLNDSAFVV